MLRAVIFDMDGVIIDSEPFYFELDKLVGRKYGIEFTDEFLHRFVGISDINMWPLVIEEYKLTETVAELKRQKAEFREKLFWEYIKEPINGVMRLLEQLKKEGIKTAVASSSSRALIAKVLETLKLEAYYDVVCSGKEMKRGKPFPDIFLKTAEFLDVLPEECVAIEDSFHGVQAACDAGMKVIGYANPNSGNQDLSKATAIVRSLQQVDVDFLKRLL